MAVTCSNDLINIYSNPYEGKITDVKMFKKSGIIDRLDQIFRKKLKRYYLFDNKTYIYQRYIISSYMKLISRRKRIFNQTMSNAKVTIKHDFE